VRDAADSVRGDSMSVELHPLCTLFPRITGHEFDALKADILANGLRQPIVLHQGFILDGGNRYRACMEVGIEPDYIEFAGGNLVSFVLSANMHRRHLTAGQQAAIVASAQDWASAQPASRPGKAGNVAGLSTVADRAAQSGASDRTQRMADAVAKKSPELARQVAHGEISLPAAAKQIAAEKPAVAAPEKKAPPALANADLAAENEALREQLAEIAENMKTTLADNEMMGRVFDADDRIKAAMDEAIRQKAIAENAERTLLAKSGEFIERARAVTHWQNRAVKAEKALAKLGGEK
jgi:hypothetical protein